MKTSKRMRRTVIWLRTFRLMRSLISADFYTLLPIFLGNQNHLTWKVAYSYHKVLLGFVEPSFV
ncbi:unnamed protein product, partial [Vitis vinifera]|uniref:Uncharacterized protein n=1 Tax=Vitis vinifera TaxID=29760 RepID=D7T327_VITVI